MIEYRQSRAEVWVVGADRKGFHLPDRSGRPWDWGAATPADWTQHEVVEHLLERGKIPAEDVRVLHGTSWRPAVVQGRPMPWDVFTYIACVEVGVSAKAYWPDASRIVVPKLVDGLGKPEQHQAAEPPQSRHVDVLLHAIRHIRLLTNPTCDAFHTATADAIHAMSGPEPGHSWWDAHLEGVRGELANLQRVDDSAAA
jgi:hypothetical protein